ncbi:MAG TPA: hypothetical protein PKW18_11360 [Candidatus Sumerlaeota bacterium]|nr:MAG: hypothetical protein BWY12_00652 [candidate division BRC1 bacterium ADurb.Bin183]HOE63357.1 hypothetical protein [Candidatus Sumerlaeota bacterium]HRR30360.1 hypothetical protein [Candidatus Sumerlaeia bacterium]HON50688.1 hypothetical protein [Candidatus Sumerlaeota bacterium]HOR65194.1 hypothetical protein [Candidatus Sumerlaeota bacterium]
MKGRLLFTTAMILCLLLAVSAYAADFEEHATGGTLNNVWYKLGAGTNFNDDVVAIADASAPDGDGYVLELYDRDNNYFGIAAACSSETPWLDLTLDGWVYAYNTPQNGVNCQVGFMFRADRMSETQYARVLLNLPKTDGEIKIQTYTGGSWGTEEIDIDDAWATTGWHHLVIEVGGVDHNEVTVTFDDHVLPTKTMAALGPGGGLADAGLIGLGILHYNAAPPIPVLFDNIKVTASPPSGIKDWTMY